MTPRFVLRDIQLAVRGLAARPAWTVAAILCLAIATGANTAAFTAVNSLLLRPLPFDEPDHLVMVALKEPLKASTRPFALGEYDDLASESSGIAALLARTFFPLSLSDVDGAQMAQVELVSRNYFDVLRLAPFAGRFFDSNANRFDEAVLSHALWRRRFGGALDVIGRSVRANGRTVTIIGIAPPGFVGATQLVAADLWLPAGLYSNLGGSAEVPMFGVMGRLSDSSGMNAAKAGLSAIASRQARARGVAEPPSVVVIPAAGFGVPPAVQGSVLSLSSFIYVLMAFLLVVAAANVAALVLSRAAGRNHEIGVRLALGASRWRIARQLLIESFVLALVGNLAGTFIAIWLVQALTARLTTPFAYVSFAIDVHPDLRVFAYSVLAAVTTAVLCGLTPIRYAARVDVIDILKRSARPGTGRGASRMLNTMVAAQFAVSTTLLLTAGLLVRSYLNAQSAHPGFDSTGLIAATLDLEQVDLDEAAGRRFYDDLTQRLATLPNVESAGLTRDAPNATRGRDAVIFPDSSASALADPVPVGTLVVNGTYLETLGVTVIQGRTFHANEPVHPLVAIVNQTLARRLAPDGSPLGRTFRLNTPAGEGVEVIGVVPDNSTRPVFYQPFAQQYNRRMTVVVRTHGDPAPTLKAMDRAIHDLNNDLAIMELRTVDAQIEIALMGRRGAAIVLTAVCAMGLMLSAVGLCGVVSYGVRQRSREIGIRLALGARPGDVRWLVLRRGITTITVGILLGGVAFLAASQVVRSMLFGVRPHDPLTIATVCGVLLGTAFLALYLPARWASNIDPQQTLKDS